MSWEPASLALLVLALAAGFGWYERRHPSARVLALVAALAALAVLGRVAFAPLPNVKPSTDIVLLAGYALGGAPGFAVGAVSALASNMFFGQGPWTPWQMLAWGMVGMGGAALARVAGLELGRTALAVACGAAALGYGLVVDFGTWVVFSGQHTLGQLLALYGAAMPFNVAHLVGNVVFCLAFGPLLVRALRRYRARFEVTWLSADGVRPAAAAGLAAAVVLGAGLLAAPGDARAASSEDRANARAQDRAVRYLERAQNTDGGFGGGRRQSSTQLHTAWVVLGLGAADRHPDRVTRNGRSPVDFVRRRDQDMQDVADLERTILALKAGGRSLRSGTGRDLVRRLLRKRREDGSFAGLVNTTSFGIFAMRAAGRSTRDTSVREAGRWLARQANDDGGFNFAGDGGTSGIDDTAAALQGLVASGRRTTRTARRAADFLERRQNSDGGFPLAPGGRSNAQSTAWAVQALHAARRDVDRIRRGDSRTPLGYLRSLQTRAGAVRYSRTSNQTPVWVTAQALTAFAKDPFPIAAPRRARRAGSSRGRSASAGDGGGTATVASRDAAGADGGGEDGGGEDGGASAGGGAGREERAGERAAARQHEAAVGRVTRMARGARAAGALTWVLLG